MDLILLLRRATLVAIIVGAGTSIGVYFLHDWFHGSFLPSLDLSTQMGDAIGTLFVIILGFVTQRFVSIALFRDWMLGLTLREAEQANRADTYISAAEQVGGELKQVKTFNDVVRGQLNTIVVETEKASIPRRRKPTP